MNDGWTIQYKLTKEEKKKLDEKNDKMSSISELSQSELKKMDIVLEERQKNIESIENIINKLPIKKKTKYTEKYIIDLIDSKFDDKKKLSGYKMININDIKKGDIIKYIYPDKLTPTCSNSSIIIQINYRKILKNNISSYKTILKNIDNISLDDLIILDDNENNSDIDIDIDIDNKIVNIKKNINKNNKEIHINKLKEITLKDIGQDVFQQKHIVSFVCKSTNKNNKVYKTVVANKYIFFKNTNPKKTKITKEYEKALENYKIINNKNNK